MYQLVASDREAADNIEQYMKESVAARDKLSKFMDKLDMDDAGVKLFLGWLEFSVSFSATTNYLASKGVPPDERDCEFSWCPL